MIRLCTLILLALVAPDAFSGAAENQPASARPLRVPEDACQATLRYLFSPDLVATMKTGALSAAVVDFQDSTTPFIHELVDSKRAWRVVLKAPEEFTAGFNSDIISVLSHCEVYLDSATGSLLKTDCELRPPSPDTTPFLSARDAEQQLRGGNEVYLGVPSELPPVTFAQALEAIPLELKQVQHIIGQYILHANRVRDLRSDSVVQLTAVPVWIVSLVGTEPRQPRGGRADWMPIYTRNRMRYVVDATTGRLRQASSAPSVTIRPEDRKRIFGR